MNETVLILVLMSMTGVLGLTLGLIAGVFVSRSRVTA